LLTLRDAATYITKLPKADHTAPWMVPVQCSIAWKPDWDIPNALHSHATGQTFRCFAMKTNFMSLPSRRRLWLS
jgi:hypothetical protein